MTINIGKARNFAADAHKDQLYGDKPYIAHLDAVFGVLKEFGSFPVGHCLWDQSLADAAYLHDVLEDTDVTFEHIRAEFGLRCAQLVEGVTDEPGENRAERKKLTYPKTAADPWCVMLKLADRIANVRAAGELEDTRLLDMYMEEYSEFRRALHSELILNETMWEELDFRKTLWVLDNKSRMAGDVRAYFRSRDF